MYFSKYNIFSRIKGSENFFIVNLLTGNADIISDYEQKQLQNYISTGGISSNDFHENLISKGYIIDKKEEEIMFKNKYLNFIDNQEDEEIQIFFVLNYSCNFACSYCYQDNYINLSNSQFDADTIIEAFFSYINSEFKGRKKYVTLFGGEPLLNSEIQRQNIKKLINKANDAELSLCIVTNGYYLRDYIDILKTAKIKEIQVTLDGTENVHNSRRFLKNKGNTFQRITEGIDACLENKISVNLRMVMDKENADNLSDLAKFAIEKGWTKHKIFKTQIGRNYELHHCQSSPDKLFDRVSLYEKLYALIKQYPNILEFHRPAFSISSFLANNGKLPDPLFDSCPACKTEWAFDYTGKIYSCTATVGKSDEVLGTFYPAVSLNNELINEWKFRDIMSINECETCSVQLACGGGCGAVAKNNTGKICSPDCRPVKELIEMGMAAYLSGEVG
jgi:uncharacterized protein